MSFGKNLGDQYGKKLIDGATKIVLKSAEATGDMIGNKIADKISSKPRSKTEKDEDNLMEETQELIIPPEKEGK